MLIRSPENAASRLMTSMPRSFSAIATANENPPFLNKIVFNHGLTYLVDGDRAIQWITDRFNGVPTTPNCGSDFFWATGNMQCATRASGRASTS